MFSVFFTRFECSSSLLLSGQCEIGLVVLRILSLLQFPPEEVRAQVEQGRLEQGDLKTTLETSEEDEKLHSTRVEKMTCFKYFLCFFNKYFSCENRVFFKNVSLLNAASVAEAKPPL